MKVYISLPITGRDMDEVKARIDSAAETLRRHGHTPVSPLEVNAANLDAPYAELIGNDIRALLQCDAAVFHPDWKESKGCRLERAACEVYGIPTYSLEELCPPPMIDPHTTISELQDLTGMTPEAYAALLAAGVRTFDDFMRYDPKACLCSAPFEVYREIKGLQRDNRDQWQPLDITPAPEHIEKPNPKAPSPLTIIETSELPSELATKNGISIMESAVQAGLCTNKYVWKKTRVLLAYFAMRVSRRLGLAEYHGKRGDGVLWKPFERLFKISELQSLYNSYQRKGRIPIGYDIVDDILDKR